MAYRFDLADRSVRAGLHRIAQERLDDSFAALDALQERPKGKAPDPLTIHELRKNIKKLRALVRLIRPVFPDYRVENAALRDAGRILAPLRDQAVLATGLRRLGQELGHPEPDLDALLLRLSAEAPSGPPDAEAALARHRAALEAIAARLPAWKPSAKGFDALAPGLALSFGRARREMKRALTTPTSEALHNWRKRVKDHWYHARLLAAIWPDAMDAHAEIAGRIGEALGEARDLAILAEALVPCCDDPAALHISDLAADYEARHLADARIHALRLFAEQPDALADRWARWWDIWRKDAA